MTQVCSQCSRINPPDASYCYFDGALLAGHARGGPINAGSAPFPSQFVLPSGQVCRNFDQLALACQQNWPAALDLLKQGYLATFFGGLGRADLAIAANEAAKFPDPDRGLDQLLAKLPTQVLQPPKLKVEPSVVNLGQLTIGADRDLELHLANQGMRLLFGSAVSDSKWLTFGEGPGGAQKLFQFGGEGVITVHVKGQHLRAGIKALEGNLVLESNGGSVTVQVRADVPIIPFAEGVLAGATTPRQIAEKAKAAPKDAAPIFEKGAVSAWFARNGWTYPVQGPSVSGVGGIQQFFEALGLAKAPKVELKTGALDLKGDVGQSLQAAIEVFTKDNKVVYAHASCDQAWVDVSKVKLAGRNGVITVAIPSVPNRPGEKLQARISVQGNGNQRFTVPLSVQVGGGNPFADLGPPVTSGSAPVLALAESPSMPASRREEFVPAVAAGPSEPFSDNPFAVIPPTLTAAASAASAVAVAPAPAATSVAAGPPAPPPMLRAVSTVVAAEPVAPPRARRSGVPFWIHLIPLSLLLAVLVGLLVHDLMLKVPEHIEQIDPQPRIAVFFDYGSDKQKYANYNTFGVFMVDLTAPKNEPPKTRLTYHPYGQTNSTVLLIDKNPRRYGSGGRWEVKPVYSHQHFNNSGQSSTFVFDPELIHVVQNVHVVPGDPVEVRPGVYSRLLDTCLVRYTIVNKDNRPHVVGLRTMIDTFIGHNDGVPFTLPGVPGLVSTQMDFDKADKVPDFIQALERPVIQDPGTIVNLKLRLEGKLEAPSRVSLTRWTNQLSAWDVPMADFGDDSAVVMYWEPRKLEPGQSRELGFSYGLGNVSRGPIGVTAAGSMLAGKELTVIAYVAEPKDKQTVSIELQPSEFELAAGSVKTQDVPTARKDDKGRLHPSPITWRVRALREGTFTIVITTSDNLSERYRVTITKVGIFGG